MDAAPTVAYTITADDEAGPYTAAIPEEMADKAKLKRLNYTSVVEALAERFHAAPALLKRLNPTARFIAGEQVQVPNIKRGDAIGYVGTTRSIPIPF